MEEISNGNIFYCESIKTEVKNLSSGCEWMCRRELHAICLSVLGVAVSRSADIFRTPTKWKRCENNRHQVQRFIALAALCLYVYINVLIAERSRRVCCLIRIPSRTQNLFHLAQSICSRHTEKGWVAKAAAKNLGRPRLTQSFAYVRAHYVTGPNDGAICQSGFWSMLKGFLMTTIHWSAKYFNFMWLWRPLNLSNNKNWNIMTVINQFFLYFWHFVCLECGFPCFN